VSRFPFFFRGREMAFLDKGREVLNRVMLACDGLGKSEGDPRMEGRYMRIMITPIPQAKPKGAKVDKPVAPATAVAKEAAAETPSETTAGE